jgi:hypothetical protein
VIATHLSPYPLSSLISAIAERRLLLRILLKGAGSIVIIVVVE